MSLGLGATLTAVASSRSRPDSRGTPAPRSGSASAAHHHRSVAGRGFLRTPDVPVLRRCSPTAGLVDWGRLEGVVQEHFAELIEASGRAAAAVGDGGAAPSAPMRQSQAHALTALHKCLGDMERLVESGTGGDAPVSPADFQRGLTRQAVAIAIYVHKMPVFSPVQKKILILYTFSVLKGIRSTERAQVTASVEGLHNIFHFDDHGGASCATATAAAAKAAMPESVKVASRVAALADVDSGCGGLRVSPARLAEAQAQFALIRRLARNPREALERDPRFSLHFTQHHAHDAHHVHEFLHRVCHHGVELEFVAAFEKHDFSCTGEHSFPEEPPAPAGSAVEERLLAGMGWTSVRLARQAEHHLEFLRVFGPTLRGDADPSLAPMGYWWILKNTLLSHRHHSGVDRFNAHRAMCALPREWNSMTAASRVVLPGGSEVLVSLVTPQFHGDIFLPGGTLQFALAPGDFALLDPASSFTTVEEVFASAHSGVPASEVEQFDQQITAFRIAVLHGIAAALNGGRLSAQSYPGVLGTRPALAACDPLKEHLIQYANAVRGMIELCEGTVAEKDRYWRHFTDSFHPLLALINVHLYSSTVVFTDGSPAAVAPAAVAPAAVAAVAAPEIKIFVTDAGLLAKDADAAAALAASRVAARLAAASAPLMPGETPALFERRESVVGGLGARAVRGLRPVPSSGSLASEASVSTVSTLPRPATSIVARRDAAFSTVSAPLMPPHSVGTSTPPLSAAALSSSDLHAAAAALRTSLGRRSVATTSASALPGVVLTGSGPRLPGAVEGGSAPRLPGSTAMPPLVVVADSFVRVPVARDGASSSAAGAGALRRAPRVVPKPSPKPTHESGSGGGGV